VRYCIFGDIHGNLHALEAVLEDCKSQQIDAYLCTGDLVGYGAFPSECIARVREVSQEVVAGNHDFAVCGKLALDFFNSYAKTAVLWTREQLNEEELDYLRHLQLTAVVDEDTTVSHATIYDPHAFDYIQTQYDAHLSLQELSTTCGFVGHSHIPIAFYLKDGAVNWTMEPALELEGCEKALVNVGSVGQPRDEDPRTGYALYDSETGRVEIRRLEYDIDREAARIRAAGLPEMLADRLYLGV